MLHFFALPIESEEEGLLVAYLEGRCCWHFMREESGERRGMDSQDM